MTPPPVGPRFLPAIIMAAAGWIAQGCGRTSLFAPGAHESPPTDAAAATATPTGGAVSQPTTQPATNGMCPQGFTNCGRGSATRCYDLTRSPEHCGKCGNACAPGIACQSSRCQQYRCKGALSFRALSPVSTLSTGDSDYQSLCTYAPVLGDFDRDGVLDFVGQTGPLAPMGLLLGRGDGSFQPHPLVSAFADAWKAAAADLNGDGWLDLATVTGEEDTGSPLIAEGTVSVRLGNGDPSTRFEPATSYPTQSVPAGLVLADLDDDGHVDLVAATEKRLTVWRGTATGKLVEPADISVGASGSFLLAADWNQDGVLDLLFGTSTLRMLLGRGDGTFDKEIACGLALGHMPGNGAGAALADFDHDGKMDVVVSSTALLGMNGCNFTTMVSVFGDPAGVSDLDGDGNADILTSFPGSVNGKMVYLGDGRGAFAGPTVLPGAHSNYEANHLVGDLDNDRKLDIIVTGPEGWQVLLNTCP